MQSPYVSINDISRLIVYFFFACCQCFNDTVQYFNMIYYDSQTLSSYMLMLHRPYSITALHSNIMLCFPILLKIFQKIKKIEQLHCHKTKSREITYRVQNAMLQHSVLVRCIPSNVFSSKYNHILNSAYNFSFRVNIIPTISASKMAVG